MTERTRTFNNKKKDPTGNNFPNIRATIKPPEAHQTYPVVNKTLQVSPVSNLEPQILPQLSQGSKKSPPAPMAPRVRTSTPTSTSTSVSLLTQTRPSRHLEATSNQHRNPDTNMSYIPAPQTMKLSTLVTITEFLLTKMTTLVQNPAQELAYSEYIRRINDMTLKANTYYLDIKADYKNNIDAAKLDDFRTSLKNIEPKTPTTYADQCTWRASNAKAPARASPPLNQT